jgi:hypothetical protein
MAFSSAKSRLKTRAVPLSGKVQAVRSSTFISIYMCREFGKRKQLRKCTDTQEACYQITLIA